VFAGARLKHEMSTLEHHLKRFAALLDEAHRTGTGTSLSMRNVAGSPRIAVQFGDKGIEPRIEHELLDSIGDAARAAGRIYLHGDADPSVASETDTKLAIRRAVAVRKLLIALKVEPERVRLLCRDTRSGVVNDGAAEPSAIKRRVEIELCI
jgi:outer membrane protein OmpA-like peptidoglycan-associated protein